MPKMKTHRGTAKRFRVTGSGKIMRAKVYKAISSPRRARSASAASVRRPSCPRLTPKPWPVISAFASSQGVIKECLV